MITLQRVMCIDPGFDGTGWAYWNSKGDFVPVFTGVIRCQKVKFKAFTYEQRMEYIWRKMSIVIRTHLPKIVYIEQMELWGGSALSYSSASRGDLFAVQSLAAGIGSYCFQQGILFKFVPAIKWKGQLPKEAVDKRIWRAIAQKYDNHISDAVGMGLSLAGKL